MSTACRLVFTGRHVFPSRAIEWYKLRREVARVHTNRRLIVNTALMTGSSIVMRCIALGREQFGLPEKEARIATHFIR